ncbi:membrane protein insertion efficiency factor YidD [Idiomarina loihiensis]|jgi:putative component of membrane protein insertase Oxa1/YidC/SpoIIIJ protein YidD|uniref:Alpha-hemolysin family protein n=1 Tax=Idiomarina loihiensis (strain ATCC BAA-735 / DSM 15497 / L2-TR) TaxID=283942 RepID=Q5R190_IDILO|nr:membrane protein insertion efficiency factor YidD [Idiomarina loihiensis]AAV82913.1 Alpha-hemolysin family protein [Idiomarina loihiensis L2TR]AGM36958.1 Alpha-hemolysin family protein [Idiomarina loihiensis GSL 199]
MVKRLILASIRWYQRRGGSRHFFNTECNFEPSCSQYTYQAISQYGSWRGIKLGVARMKRCNDPDCVNKKHDPVPEKVLK